MAILSDNTALSFDEFHFESDEFDALLEAHGTPCELRLGMRCGCWDIDTGQPDPACALCYPLGYLYDAPTTVKVFGPNRRAFFTFPTGIVPTVGSRLMLPLSTIVVDDMLTKGSEDTIRFAQVLAVERAHYSQRNPPTGPDYQVETVPLAFTGGTPDITIAGREVTWLNALVPAGTRYVVRFTTRAEYVVMEVQDRNEGGRALPYRCLGKRYDFLLHPRGTKQVSF